MKWFLSKHAWKFSVKSRKTIFSEKQQQTKIGKKRFYLLNYLLLFNFHSDTSLLQLSSHYTLFVHNPGYNALVRTTAQLLIPPMLFVLILYPVEKNFIGNYLLTEYLKKSAQSMALKEIFFQVFGFHSSQFVLNVILP